MIKNWFPCSVNPGYIAATILAISFVAIASGCESRNRPTAIMINQLSSKNSDVRADAARALVFKDDAKLALPRLIELAADESPKVRAAVIFALISIDPDSEEVKIIVSNAIFDESAEVGRELTGGTIGLIELDKNIILPNMIKALKDENSSTRHRAVSIIRQHNRSARTIPNELIQILFALVNDQNGGVRLGAVITLLELDSKLGFGPVLVPGLIEKLDDEMPEIRELAVRGLARYPVESREVFWRTIELLKDEDKNVQRSSILVLHNYGDAAKDALPVLIELIDDADWEVRHSAAYNIGWLSQKEVTVDALDAVISALDDELPVVRRSAVKGLMLIGQAAKKALPKLKEMANSDEDSTVRYKAKAAYNAISSTE